MKNDDLEFEDEVYKEPNSNTPSRSKKPFYKKPSFMLLFLLIAFVVSIVMYDTYYGNQIVKNIIEKQKDSEENVENDIVDEGGKTAKESDYMTFGSDTKSIFNSFGGGFLHCTKDGIKFYTEMGKEKWNDTFTMASPSVIVEGDYVAVADIMGRTVKMYNSNGKVYDLSMDYPIAKVSINKNGFMGVLMNGSSSYIIKIINSEGEVVAERVEATKNVFPMCLDISEDNNVFAVGYVDTTDIEAVSKVVFFYVSENGGDYIDGMFGAISKEGEYIGYLSYVDGNNIVAITDSSVFAMDSTAKEVWSYKLNNKLEYISLSAGSYIALGCGDSMDGKDGYRNGTVVFLNTNGKEAGTFESGGQITYLKSYSQGTVVGNGKKFKLVKKNGGLVWEHRATQDIKDIIPMDKNNVLYVTRNYVQYVDIKNYVPVSLKDYKNDTENNETTEETNVENQNNEVLENGEAENSENVENTNSTDDSQAETPSENAQ